MTRRSIGDSNVMGKMSSELEQISSTTWSRLQLLDAAIRPTLACPLSQSVAEKIASDLGLHWVTVYRYRQRLLASNVTTAMAGRDRGFPNGASRLSTDQVTIIDKVIARFSRASRKWR